MVAERARRGGSMVGCLLWVVLLVGAGWVGLQFARPWFANQQFEDEMKTAARFATTLSDSVIRRRVVARADSLGLPREAKRVVIRRSEREGVITIRSRYEVTVTLPVIGPTVLSFEPQAREPL